MWCQGEDIGEGEQSTETLLRQVTIGVTALAQQEIRLKEIEA